jgi:hypothetical protein
MPADWSLLKRIAPEGALLLLCAGPHSNDEEIGPYAAKATIDWQLLLWMAERERAASVVWRRLSALSPNPVPERFHADFTRQSMVTEFSAKYLEQRTLDTLRAWNAAGIEPLLLKGAAMGLTVFSTFSDRPMGDVDVLVDANQSQEAWEIARDAGWVWEPRLYPQSRYLGHHHLPPLYARKGIDVKLEVHTAIFVAGHPFGFGDQDMLRGATQIGHAGARARVPSRASLLLHAVLHFAWSHTLVYGGWRTYRDIAALSATGVDWGEFERWASDRRAASTSYWTLNMARRLTCAAVDEGVLSRLERLASPRWKRLVERHLVRDTFPQVDGCPSALVRRWMWELAIQPGRSGHGAIRPWHLDEPAVEPSQATFGEGVLSVVRNAGRLRAWSHYLRALLLR